MCEPVIPISDKQKRIEEALLNGLRIYLNKRKYLTNAKGEKLMLVYPFCKELKLASRTDLGKLEFLMESNTNYHPCLQAHVKLIHRNEKEPNYKETQYFFHISGDKSAVGGDADYMVSDTNEGTTISITYVDYFFRDGNRLF